MKVYYKKTRQKKVLAILIIAIMITTMYLPSLSSDTFAATKLTFDKCYTYSYVLSSNTYAIHNLKSDDTVVWNISDDAKGFVSFSKTDQEKRNMKVTVDKDTSSVKVYTFGGKRMVLGTYYTVKATIFNSKGKKVGECSDEVIVSIDAKSVKITNHPDNFTMYENTSFKFKRKLSPVGTSNETFWIVTDERNKELTNTKTGVMSNKVTMNANGVFTPKVSGIYNIAAVAYRSKNAKVRRAISTLVTVKVVSEASNPVTPTEAPSEAPSVAPSVSPGSVPASGSNNSNPVSEPTETITMKVDGFEAEAPLNVNTESINLTGVINTNTGVKEAKVSYYSNSNVAVRTHRVEGANPFKVSSLPLDIGTNYITITGTATRGTSVKKDIVVNRLSKVVRLSDNVIGFDSTTEEGLHTIEEIYHGIENFWMDDMGTPEDTNDDVYHLVVHENSPLMEYILRGTYQAGNIIYIPQCEYFPAGLTLIYRAHSDEYREGYEYDSNTYEVIQAQFTGISDLLKDDVCINTSEINAEDPIAFVLAPGGTELYLPDEDNEEVAVPPENAEIRSFAATEPNSVINEGFQFQNISEMIQPTLDFSDLYNGSVVFKFNDAILYDKDGDRDGEVERKTENDRVTVSGEISLKNIKPTFGLEWNPSLTDPLPKQFISKISYNENQELKCTIGEEISNLRFVIEDYKKATNSFRNKCSFVGMDIEGINMDNSILIAAIGLNMAGVVGVDLKTIQSISTRVPFNPIAVIYVFLNAEGKLSTELVIEYSHSSYVEKGVNVQKEGYVGSHGSCAQNTGTTNFMMGDRNINIYDLSCKSFYERNLQGVNTVSIKGNGTAEVSITGGAACGIMFGGILPAAVGADVGPRIKANLNGKVSFSTLSDPVFEGASSLNMKLSAKAAADLRFVAKTALGNPGFNVHRELLELIFLEFNLSTTAFRGKVYATDSDRDITNNPVLDSAKVTLSKPGTASADNTVFFETSTGSDGSFDISNVSAGDYILSVSKDGYVTYLNNNYAIEGTGSEKNIYLDAANQSATLSGLVTKADEDTNSSNNVPLSAITVSLTKLGSSNLENIVTTTGEDGRYSFENLPFGLYEISITDSNFIPIVSEIMINATNITIYNITLEAISNNYAGNGIANGVVINALSGTGVEPGLTLSVRKGYNISYGEPVASTTTGVGGAYTLNLPAGNYTVFVTDNRTNVITKYHEGYFNIKTMGNITINNQNGQVTPILSNDEIRIVLSWGEVPRDLDSHLSGPTSSGGSFHTYFSSKSYLENSAKIVQLDVDDTTSYGPETTTIYRQMKGIYKFSIHDYTNRGSTNSNALASSGALVQVYFGSTVLSYYVPGQPGTTWDVFQYNSETGEFVVLNTMYYQSSPEAVGRQGSMMRRSFAAPESQLKDYEMEEMAPKNGKDVTIPEIPVEPTETEAEVTEPEVTEPEVTEPEVIEPEVTEPEVTEPEVTEPEVTKPEVTEPEVTKPEVTEPEVIEPEVTEQEVTEPEVTEPEVTEPEVKKPEVSEPEGQGTDGLGL